jgi:phosphatidylglycerophosphate synthase
VDGELARLKFQFSRLGKWIDNIGDHVVDLAVILFVAWRAAVASSSEILAALGAVAGIGVTGAFLLVFWWSVSGGLPQPPAGGTRAIFARGLRALANRDGFCLPLWVTMLLNRPEWLLWAFALGANAYWIVWLLVFGVPQRAGAERAAQSS